jgi:hypothetical protein
VFIVFTQTFCALSEGNTFGARTRFFGEAKQLILSFVIYLLAKRHLVDWVLVLSGTAQIKFAALRTFQSYNSAYKKAAPWVIKSLVYIYACITFANSKKPAL